MVDIIYGKEVCSTNEELTMCDSMCEESLQGLDRAEELLMTSRKPRLRSQSNHSKTAARYLRGLASVVELVRQQIENEEE